MEDAPTTRARQPSTVIRTIAFVLPAVAFIALLGFAVLKKGGSLEPGEPAPSFTAPLLIGEGEMSLDDLRGTPVVLNFWASWCAPCEDEAPLLSAAAERYDGEIAFIGVDIKDAKSEAIEFAREHDLDYPHVRDEDSSIYSDYGLTGQPETFFISADGTLVEHVPGPVFEGDLERILQGLAADG